MQIIITDAWVAKKRTLHINGWRVVVLGFIFSLVMVVSTVAIYNWVLLEGVRRGWPIMQSFSQVVSPQSNAINEVFVRDNLDALARKLGEMQAHMVLMDTLIDRVAGVVGMNPEEIKASQGSGGTLIQSQSMTLNEVMDITNVLKIEGNRRMDWLMVAEDRLFDQKMQVALKPTKRPVKDVRVGSGFGFRIDPINGRRSMHAGVDFPAPVGTPILAAAGGVVIVQQYHEAYGNMIEIDHGNDINSLYAHASKTFVKTGDIVKRGQTIAAVGSTGRSTGPHLHFEVLVSGRPQDPQLFLTAGENLNKMQSLTGRRSN